MAAGPSEFFDPFFEAIKPEQVAAPPVPSNGTDTEIGVSPAQGSPRSFGGGAASLTQYRLPITGQGTIAVESDAQDRLLFSVKTSTLGAPTLYLEIDRSECRMFYGNIEAAKVTPITPDPDSAPSKPANAFGLWSGRKVRYWLSLDKNNGILRYGKFYTNVAETLFRATLKKKAKDPKTGEEGVMVWINPTEHSWLEGLKTFEVIQDHEEVGVGSTSTKSFVPHNASPLGTKKNKHQACACCSGSISIHRFRFGRFPTTTREQQCHRSCQSPSSLPNPV